MTLRNQERESPREFTTTHWSVVLLAGGEASTEADRALDDLCRAYWYPLYAYVRRQGRSAGTHRTARAGS